MDRRRRSRQRVDKHDVEQIAGSGADSDFESVLGEVSARFSEFRRSHGAGSRVPESLRQMILEALEQGVPMSALRRECGVGTKQVTAWREHTATASPAGGVEVREPARVFDVTGPSRPSAPAYETSQTSESIELRVGAWSVVIRSAAS